MDGIRLKLDEDELAKLEAIAEARNTSLESVAEEFIRAKLKAARKELEESEEEKPH